MLVDADLVPQDIGDATRNVELRVIIQGQAGCTTKHRTEGERQPSIGGRDFVVTYTLVCPRHELVSHRWESGPDKLQPGNRVHFATR